MPQFFLTHLNFQTNVSPKVLIDFFSSRSQSEVFSLCWKISLKSRLCCVQYSPDGLQTLESATNIERPRFSNSFLFSFTCFIFPQEVNRYFFRKWTLHFSTPWNFLFYIVIRILIDENWQKCFFCRNISKIKLILLKNYGFEFLYQGLSCKCYFSGWLLVGSIFDFVHEIEVLIRWTCEKLQLPFLFCLL